MDIIAVTNLHEVQEISEAALADNHYALAPTHYWRDTVGEVAGFFSCGVIPVGHFWMRRSAKPRQSMKMVKKCEEVAKSIFGSSIRYGMIACQKSSPFHDTLKPHFGYDPIVSDVTLFGIKLAK